MEKKLFKKVAKQTKLIFFFLFISFTMIKFIGCCTYSFTGASVPEHLNSIAIPISEDRSGAGVLGLRELLTEGIINKFIEDNSLQVAERSEADAILESVIVSFSDAPSIVSAGENISSRRVTITVKVVYKDLVERKTIFDQNFSNYGDYEPADVENKREQAIETALDKISEDILLAVVSGW